MDEIPGRTWGRSLFVFNHFVDGFSAYPIWQPEYSDLHTGHMRVSVVY